LNQPWPITFFTVANVNFTRAAAAVVGAAMFGYAESVKYAMVSFCVGVSALTEQTSAVDPPSLEFSNFYSKRILSLSGVMILFRHGAAVFPYHKRVLMMAVSSDAFRESRSSAPTPHIPPHFAIHVSRDLRPQRSPRQRHPTVGMAARSAQKFGVLHFICQRTLYDLCLAPRRIARATGFMLNLFWTKLEPSREILECA
jgi:hypothetical protein